MDGVGWRVRGAHEDSGTVEMLEQGVEVCGAWVRVGADRIDGRDVSN